MIDIQRIFIDNQREAIADKYRIKIVCEILYDRDTSKELVQELRRIPETIESLVDSLNQQTELDDSMSLEGDDYDPS